MDHNLSGINYDLRFIFMRDRYGSFFLIFSVLRGTENDIR